MTTVWGIDSEVAHVGDEDRVALVDLKHLDRFPVVLTDSAAAIWAALDGIRDEDAVVEAVALSFGLSPDEIRDQVLLFLRDLAEQQLIVRA